eukprot:m.347701 g.347701  ORF g.347701 m.347701 type:complete len:352 (+) comp27927_c0_seq1:1094-2149(+)
MESATPAVPNGFFCGFPTQSQAMGYEVYGGVLYAQSLDRTPQGLAIQEASRKWGHGDPGREVIPFGICKHGFRPFRSAKDGPPESVFRVYGCVHHHHTRRHRIEACGVREEWQSFDEFEPPARSTVVAEDFVISPDAAVVVEVETGDTVPPTATELAAPHPQAQKAAKPRARSSSAAANSKRRQKNAARRRVTVAPTVAGDAIVLGGPTATGAAAPATGGGHTSDSTVVTSSKPRAKRPKAKRAAKAAVAGSDPAAEAAAPRRQNGGARVKCDQCGVEVAVTGLALHMDQFHRGQAAKKRRKTNNSGQDNWADLTTADSKPDDDTECMVKCDHCSKTLPFSKYLAHWSSHY